MPNLYPNFKESYFIDELSVNIDGWINPICIEYGYTWINNHQFLLWQIKDTTHTFRILTHELHRLGCTIDQHFITILQDLRNNYIEWLFYENQESWMLEYIQIYKNYIIL